ncbi:MAG: aldehyde dehydrogenase family protein [Candidatus Acidiferrales bacterium]
MTAQPQSAAFHAGVQTIRRETDDVVVSIDASSGRVVAELPATPVAAVPEIMARARAAQKDWAARSIESRCAALRGLRDAIYEQRDEIARTISLETGKPHVEAVFSELILALDTTDFLARLAPEWLRPERVPHHNIAVKAKTGWLQFEPHGVVAVISPWNYSFSIPISEIVPALVAGNAVLLKPSELTPQVGALIARVAAAAKLPSGILQVLQGSGALGEAIIDAKPDKVCFTGSVATGRRIAEACARLLIPTVLELGGKDAMLVLGDADLDVASSAAVWGAYTNCGQACLSVERIYADATIVGQFTQMCVEKTGKLRLGPPSDADAEIGPMIRPRQIETVEEHLRDAVAKGARILAGGRRRPDLGPSFFEPTVVVNVDHSMKLMREETFGPVLAIAAVKSIDEAIARANDSEFGLSASVWTSDSELGKAVASRLRAGSVMVNDVASYYGVCEAPHGGSGASGWGHAHSRLGLLDMVRVKYVDVDRMPRTPKSWWFGYSESLAAAADRFADFLFAPRWRRRIAALGGSRGALGRGALGTVFRKHRI